MFKGLIEEIDSYVARDPALRNRWDVVLSYPGFHALTFYRAANWLWRKRRFTLGRFVSHLGRMMSGIEIHPGATIGKRLFIDHGMGVVIGETAEVGDDVTLYQGVTLGGTALDQGKRHPTLEDCVIVGSGAQILGPFTVGAGARVGANAVVVNAVPPAVTVVGIPAKIVKRAEPTLEPADFAAYGVAAGMADPVARSLTAMQEELKALRTRVEELEGDAASVDPVKNQGCSAA
ncbi:serine O-acetyltransferase [Alphaproteobacteria bacterium]|jgi:serine O-acetyltransferase|nr:serine O-acetyltransferase [Alphaproteobacteria bacterium]